MFCKQCLLLSFFFLAFFYLAKCQTQPQVVIDQILEGGLSPVIKYTVNDNELDSIEHNILAFSVNDETLRVPFSIDDFSSYIKTGEQWATEIQFNADSLAKYNVDLQDIAIKVVAHKPASKGLIKLAVNNVTAEKLQQYMSEVEGVRNVVTNNAHYLKVQQLFDSLGLIANYNNLSYDYTFAGNDGKNLVAAKKGIVDEGSTILITAHYDTVIDSPGADDNGSGLCGLLMAMEVLKSYNFEKNIKIVSFDDEEIGLLGSFNYIKDGIEENEHIKGVFNLEMIGYASDEPNSQQLPLGFDLLFPEATNYVEENDFKGNFLICVGNDASAGLISTYINAATEYVPDLEVLSLQTPANGQITQDLRRSDHAPFWDNGYQALMLTDGANFRNPFYHTPADISAVLDFDFMANSVKATVAAVMETAEPIIYDEATGFVKDAVIVNVDDLENIKVFDLEISGLGIEKTLFYQLPNKINQAMLKIYNLNGQFLKTIKLNSNKGRLSLGADYNLNQFAFVVVDVDFDVKYVKKIVIFP